MADQLIKEGFRTEQDLRMPNSTHSTVESIA